MDRSVPAGASMLLDFIGSKEAPKGYGTVYGNNQAKLHKPLTSWTVGEIIDAKPSFTKRFGSSACGRYQFMRNTLKSLVAEGACRLGDVLTPNLQDRLGYRLLRRRGYDTFMSGKISRTEFGRRLAQEWASFPVLANCKGAHRQVKRGQSFYVGDQLNKALVSAAEVERVLDQVLAMGGQSVPLTAVPMPAPRPENIVAPPLVEVEESEEEDAAEPPAAEDPSPVVARKVQQLLKERGYHEVGMVGTSWGDRSWATLSAWKSSWNRRNPHDPVEIGDVLTDDIIEKLERDEHRPISVERATATAADLPDDTSWYNRLWNRVLGIGAALGFGGAAASTETENGTSAIDKIEQVSSGWVRIHGILDSLGGFAMNNWLLILVVLVVGGYMAKEHWKKRKVEKFKTGELLV